MKTLRPERRPLVEAQVLGQARSRNRSALRPPSGQPHAYAGAVEVGLVRRQAARARRNVNALIAHSSPTRTVLRELEPLSSRRATARVRGIGPAPFEFVPEAHEEDASLQSDAEVWEFNDPNSLGEMRPLASYEVTMHFELAEAEPSAPLDVDEADLEIFDV